MKRLLPALLCAMLLLLLGGCGGKPILSPPPEETVEKLSSPFQSDLTIAYGELSAQATLTRGEPGTCTVAFTSPEELADMSFSLSAGELGVAYGPLHLSLDPDSLPGSSAVKLLVAAVDAAVQGQGVDLAYDNGAVTVDGKAEFGSFALRLDSKSGNLLEVRVPSENLAVTFQNFRFLT